MIPLLSAWKILFLDCEPVACYHGFQTIFHRPLGSVRDNLVGQDETFSTHPVGKSAVEDLLVQGDRVGVEQSGLCVEKKILAGPEGSVNY